MGLPPISGVFVSNVSPDGPADEAGLRKNDVIVGFAGMPVGDSRDLQTLVEQRPAGSRHPLIILREGRRQRLEISLADLPASES